MPAIQELAQAVYGFGANVVPIGAGQKKPLGQWSQWQTARQTAADVAAMRWGDADRFGIVNGPNGLRSFDVDDNNSEFLLNAILGKLGLSEDYPWVEQSQSGSGWHIWVICQVDELPDLPVIGKGQPGVFIGEVPGGGVVELRWKENQTIVAGSADESRWRHGFPSNDFAIVSPKQLTGAFLSVAIPKDRKVRPQRFQGQNVGDRPGDDFNVRGDIRDLLRKHKWSFVDRAGEVEYWRRPGKSDGTASATLNYYPGLFYVFSSNAAPFADNEGYTLFATYAILEHNGNWKEAATALRSEGYGNTGPLDLTDAQKNFARVAHYSDLGNAEVFREIYGQDYKYDGTRKLWLRWNGIVWEPDYRHRTQRDMLDTIRVRGTESWGIVDDARRRNAQQWAIKSESGKHYTEALERVKTFDGIATLTTEFDADIYTLGMQNGVYTLPRLFEPEGKPEQLVTKQTNVVYNPESDCPVWESFIDDIFAGNSDIISYVQKALGMSLSGSMSDQAFFICYGDGANGKSTMLNTVRKVVGDYGTTTSFQTFDADSRNEYGNDMAELKGRRFVVAIEAEQNKKLAEARVKTITGGDDISCRFLYGQLFTYTPTCKVWLAVNHKPQVRGADHGIWRRLHLIPFTVRFGPGGSKPINRQLEAQLSEEFPGIFNWLVRGFEQWQAEGLTRPKAILDATSEYQVENDSVARWLDEECEIGPEYQVEAGEAYKAYRAWMLEQGEAQRFVPNMTFWGHRMTEKAFHRVKNGKGRSEYRGIRVKSLDLGIRGN